MAASHRIARFLTVLSVIASVYGWGSTFGSEKGPPSNNVVYDCIENGFPICCSLQKQFTEVTVAANQKVGKPAHAMAELCTIERKYVSSPYELEQFEAAVKFAAISDTVERTKAIIKFFSADIDDSKKWLARVKVHSSSEVSPEPTPDDLKYLSRFEITKTCNGTSAGLSQTWTEWIEPLTTHARHPFGMAGCKAQGLAVASPQDAARMGPPTSLVSLDYIIIKSGSELHEETKLSSHKHDKLVTHQNHHKQHRTDHIQSRNFFFDAGTSTFQSSLLWFICAYLQRKVAFDQDYGWEYTLLEPVDFWKRVPNLLKPIYHFFNSPIEAEPKADMSPLRFIAQVAAEDDFVAFKLDVDTPVVEIPQALELLHNPTMHKLVDEFFFELHFRCEVLMYCGWKNKMKEEYAGLKLDRLGAMTFFRELRQVGVRAHFWP